MALKVLAKSDNLSLLRIFAQFDTNKPIVLEGEDKDQERSELTQLSQAASKITGDRFR